MNLQLNDYLSYRQYFSALAASSIHIDGFIHGDIELGQQEASEWQGLKLWAWPATRSRTNDVPDNLILEREGSIWVGGPCASELYDEQQTFYQNCEQVMKKIIARLLFDRSEGVISVKLAGQVDRADMSISSTRFIGCELKFMINDPDGFQFDENDWE